MEMNDYMEIFTQKINLLDKISHRIYKEERGKYEQWILFFFNVLD